MEPEKLSQAYYHTLGILPDATLAEIKKAYRKKAKEWHPDLNHAPGARQKFIEVNEAYEFLVRLRLQPQNATQRRRKRQQQDPYHEWLEKERNKARARAAAEARKNYEEFKKSPLYKTSSFLYGFYDYLSFAIGVFIIIAAWTGLVLNLNPNEGITVAAIISALLVSIIGVVFIIFSYSSIKSKNKPYK